VPGKSIARQFCKGKATANSEDGRSTSSSNGNIKGEGAQALVKKAVGERAKGTLDHRRSSTQEHPTTMGEGRNSDVKNFEKG